jgi:GntR family transcriptional repressor for pyruvate dehydrogenase complex
LDHILERLKELLSETNPNPEGKTRLPSERELAEALGVNRTTLREKMSVLEAVGFITRTQGSGTFLSMPRSKFLQFYFDMALKLGFISIPQLEEVREMIEAGVARAAAAHATDEDINALEYFLNQMMTAGDTPYGNELDHAFHMHLGTATHNPVMIMILDGLALSMRKVLQHRRRIISQFPRGLDITNDTHTDIYNAVKAHEPDQAEQAMSNHFKVWRRIREESNAG